MKFENKKTPEKLWSLKSGWQDYNYHTNIFNYQLVTSCFLFEVTE